MSSYWSRDPLFWQVLIDHNKDVQDERFKKAAFLGQPISWSMVDIVAMLPAPTSNAASHDYRKKSYSWFLRVWCCALRPYGPSELRYKYIMMVK